MFDVYDLESKVCILADSLRSTLPLFISFMPRAQRSDAKGSPPAAGGVFAFVWFLLWWVSLILEFFGSVESENTQSQTRQVVSIKILT